MYLSELRVVTRVDVNMAFTIGKSVRPIMWGGVAEQAEEEGGSQRSAAHQSHKSETTAKYVTVVGGLAILQENVR